MSHTPTLDPLNKITRPRGLECRPMPWNTYTFLHKFITKSLIKGCIISLCHYRKFTSFKVVFLLTIIWRNGSELDTNFNLDLRQTWEEEQHFFYRCILLCRDLPKNSLLIFGQTYLLFNLSYLNSLRSAPICTLVYKVSVELLTAGLPEYVIYNIVSAIHGLTLPSRILGFCKVSVCLKILISSA